jgi:hypothetical protein
MDKSDCNFSSNITIDDHEVGGLTDFDGADLVFQSEGLRAVVRSDSYGLYGAEPPLVNSSIDCCEPYPARMAPLPRYSLGKVNGNCLT